MNESRIFCNKHRPMPTAGIGRSVFGTDALLSRTSRHHCYQSKPGAQKCNGENHQNLRNSFDSAARQSVYTLFVNLQCSPQLGATSWVVLRGEHGEGETSLLSGSARIVTSVGLKKVVVRSVACRARHCSLSLAFDEFALHIVRTYPSRAGQSNHI
jgi:hypothetical protein